MKTSLATAFFLLSMFAQAQQWHFDLADATKVASSEKKNLLLFFSVADACDACRRLDNSVFKSPEFITYANANLVLVKLDFQKPESGAQAAENLRIVEKYNKDGFFPWVVLIDGNGRVLLKADLYEEQSPAEYLRKIKDANG
ncbi:MAG: thioredoxin family protein [Chitinophagaceae bacterium]|nr:MAG: thioredoxin family protein [Chitinophagaceae bacterium]